MTADLLQPLKLLLFSAALLSDCDGENVISEELLCKPPPSTPPGPPVTGNLFGWCPWNSDSHCLQGPGHSWMPNIWIPTEQSMCPQHISSPNCKQETGKDTGPQQSPPALSHAHYSYVYKEVNLVLFSPHVVSYQIRSYICHIMSHHVDEEEASMECWRRYMDEFQETSALWILCKILCLSEYFQVEKFP